MMPETALVPLARRSFIASLAATGLLVLPGCATVERWSYIDAVRRLLTLASQDALARLMAPGGFWDNQMVRLQLPEVLGTRGSALQNILTSALFRERIQRELNHVAEDGARRAAPAVADAIRTVGIENAAALIHGGPTAATSFLRQQMAGRLIEVMIPELGVAMRVANDPLINQTISALAGVDITTVARELSREVDDAIWGEIGREEAAIRADPQRTRDPVLIAALKAL